MGSAHSFHSKIVLAINRWPIGSRRQVTPDRVVSQFNSFCNSRSTRASSYSNKWRRKTMEKVLESRPAAGPAKNESRGREQSQFRRKSISGSRA